MHPLPYRPLKSLIALLLGALAGSPQVMAQDNELPLRPSARLIFQHPAFLAEGSCVRYREGGAGWIMIEPEFYLQGSVLSSRSEARRLVACPHVPGKNPEQYSREEFNRLASAYPCLAAGEPERTTQVGLVRLRVDRWETPHARITANRGRLYRGAFIDRPLKTGMEIELEADLLETCAP